ncbi:hypothetical protein [Thermomonospora catenispora]|uniref:hypothetical protein n=1 Tax=Thermomonospora catenispora TaxID=2493090 RepID=UPI001375D17F|nr:hypothetical protein [Thermomonospora catenispora]
MSIVPTDQDGRSAGEARPTAERDRPVVVPIRWACCHCGGTGLTSDGDTCSHCLGHGHD